MVTSKPNPTTPIYTLAASLEHHLYTILPEENRNLLRSARAAHDKAAQGVTRYRSAVRHFLSKAHRVPDKLARSYTQALREQQRLGEVVGRCEELERKDRIVNRKEGNNGN